MKRLFKTAPLVCAAVLALLVGGRPAAAQTYDLAASTSSFSVSAEIATEQFISLGYSRQSTNILAILASLSMIISSASGD